MMLIRRLVFFIFLLPLARVSFAQGSSGQPDASRIFHRIEKLGVLGSVLYFAAHPDDENTGFIAFMANERKLQTAYLSLTRGDGGQNLIGPEMRELLGIIRTQELLKARGVDGGKQFFTRANDFGYSKSPDETLAIWDREKVLADAVWVIRKTRPDIIVTRFPPDERAGHGHHTASALLAAEAFDAAGDPNRFPEQLSYVKTWQPKRLLWNISMWFIRDREAFVKNAASYLKLDIGTFNPLLGASYGELAATSRSMHKSQGFGTLAERGTDVEYFEYVKGEKAQTDLMDGINTGWERVEGGTKISDQIDAIKKGYDLRNPAASVPALLKLRSSIKNLQNDYWTPIKLGEVDEVIREALGLHLEAAVDHNLYTPGQEMKLSLAAINRSGQPVSLESVEGPFGLGNTAVDSTLKNNQPVSLELKALVPATQPISQPYWLNKDIGYAGLFEVTDQLKIGLPENASPAEVAVRLSVAGEKITYKVPVFFKKRDPVRGEVHEPVVIAPPVYTMLSDDVFMFRDGKARQVRVTVTSVQGKAEGTIRLKVPDGWVVSPAFARFRVAAETGKTELSFSVTPPAGEAHGEVVAETEINGQRFDRSMGVIAYEHIPRQVYFPQSKARVVRLDLKIKGHTIGYVEGAGDAMPASLREIGYQVTILEDKDLDPNSLRKFDAVILGVRAFNTRPALAARLPALLAYAEAGGNIIVQYNTSSELPAGALGPYPFDLSRERVSVEDAAVRILDPNSPVLRFPNRITAKDFDGWVQERGLYFPQNWDKRYKTVISSNDPGGAPLDGGILYTQVGKGFYVYSSLSWFRELPAGVPGAYRLFVNLISLGKQAQ